ncbi:hypothetical protein LCGC14_2526330, partial [marine sediment metagenome]
MRSPDLLTGTKRRWTRHLSKLPRARRRKIAPVGLPWPASRGYLLAKRVMDLLAGTALLVLTLPVMALAAAAIKLASRGPILFSQLRVGLNGEHFRMYKFRSMVPGAQD